MRQFLLGATDATSRRTMFALSTSNGERSAHRASKSTRVQRRHSPDHRELVSKGYSPPSDGRTEKISRVGQFEGENDDSERKDRKEGTHSQSLNVGTFC